MATDSLPLEAGASAPLGATLQDGGVNFSVFSKHATRVDLLLFDAVDAAQPARIVALEPPRHRTYHYWHALVPGLGPGQIYAYRAHGPLAPERGLRFDPEKVLFDPYGRRSRVPDGYDRRAASRPGDNTAPAIKSVVADPRPLRLGRRPAAPPAVRATVIYEMHVGGFTGTQAPACRRAARHLRRPDREDSLPAGPGHHGRRTPAGVPVRSAATRPDGANYWGYQPLSFFAPHHGYSSRPDPLGVIDEFRDMVKALHRAGIEVILDVVFNHTAEGGADGPTLCYRGLANDFYYMLEPDGHATRTTRLRQHAQRQPADRPAADPGQPALLGHRDARGRVPLRPGVDPVARRSRPAACRIRRCCGTSSPIRCWPARS